MEMKFRKFLPLIGALCASICVSSVHAETRYDDNHPNSMMHKQSKPTPPGKQGTYQRGMYREITPNAGPRVAHGADVFLTADYLLWKMVQDGDEFAQTGVVTAATDMTTIPSTAKGTIKDGNTHWKSGFRVGLGLNLSHDGWDLYAEYTWMRGRGKNSIGSAPGCPDPVIGVFPTTILAIDQNPAAAAPSPAIPDGSPLEGTPFFQSAKTREKMRYNVINLELGRNFYVSQFLMLRPHFGFSGTWQRFRQRSTYSGGDNGVPIQGEAGSVTTIAPVIQYQKRDKNKYWGVGMRAGFDTAWHFTTQWSIFGDIAWTAMWSCYDLERKDTAFQASETDATCPQQTGSVVFYGNPGKKYKIKYMGELEIGLRWEMWFYDDNYHFSIQTGWYGNVWINHMPFIEIRDNLKYEDLSMHGLDVKFRFDF